MSRLGLLRRDLLRLVVNFPVDRGGVDVCCVCGGSSVVSSHNSASVMTFLGAKFARTLM